MNTKVCQNVSYVIVKSQKSAGQGGKSFKRKFWKYEEGLYGPVLINRVALCNFDFPCMEKWEKIATKEIKK